MIFMAMAKVFKTAIVEKRNVLNEIRKNNMSLQELRFFSIYLSKINPRDVKTRVVRFPLTDFQKIMEIGSDMNINHFKLIAERLLQQIVSVPNESGYGFNAFQLFKKFKVNRDEEFGEWYVEIDANDEALPLMFEFKNKYFTYELWNALQLKSNNQIRMYEILKQYEKIGKRELKVDELKDLLGIPVNEYPRWSNFKIKVLDSCQKALKEYTDICFTYEKGKSGVGGRWITIIFHIQKNNSHTSQITLDEFIEQQPAADEHEDDEYETQDNKLELYKDALCRNGQKCEFSQEQLEEIFQILVTIDDSKLPQNVPFADLHFKRHHYLAQKFAKLNRMDEDKKIKHRFNYFLKMLKQDAGLE